MATKNNWILGNYLIYRKYIGKGSFSKIYKGLDQTTNEIVAKKKIEKKNIKNTKLVLREIQVLKTLKHKNILKLKNVLVTTKYFFLILEYCENGDLKNYLNFNNLNEKDVQNILKQVKDGLEYLYKKKIIHRDLKLQNILLGKNNQIKIADFGFAKYCDNLSQTICGSPLYMAPEILNYKKYNSKADLWSFGILMYELLFDDIPYNPNNLNELINILKHFKYKNPNKKISFYADDLLNKLLIKESEKRISWNDFFNHKWFKTQIKLQNKIIDNDLIFDFDFDDIDDDIDNDIDNIDNNKNCIISVKKSKSFNINRNYIRDSLLQSSYNDNIDLKNENFILVNSPTAAGSIIRNIPNQHKNIITTSFTKFKNSINSFFPKSI